MAAVTKCVTAFTMGVSALGILIEFSLQEYQEIYTRRLLYRRNVFILFLEDVRFKDKLMYALQLLVSGCRLVDE